MAGKPQPLILKRSDFRVYLFAQMRIKGYSPQQFADELGITLTRMYDLLAGDELPSDELVDKAGLEMVYIMKDELAEKPKKGTK